MACILLLQSLFRAQFHFYYDLNVIIYYYVFLKSKGGDYKKDKVRV